MNRQIKWQDDSGLALVMSIMFTLVITGLALTLYATTFEDNSSSVSQVTNADCFNMAEAGLNVGLMRVRSIVTTYATVDEASVFSSPPFNLEEESEGVESIEITNYGYFDLVAMTPLPQTSKSKINNGYVDPYFQTYIRSIDGFFKPETSNPDGFSAYLAGAEPVYSTLVDIGGRTYVRGWRIYLHNDNDMNDNTATLISVGYVLDPASSMVYSKKIEAKVYMQSEKDTKDVDLASQVTGSETGASTGKFRVDIDDSSVVESTSVR
jgi:hypothetical protein